MFDATCDTQAHADLPIGKLTSRARVLALHADGTGLLLEEAGIVDDPRGHLLSRALSAARAYLAATCRTAWSSQLARPRKWRSLSWVLHLANAAAALIDRFVQHCHVDDIDGDAWRQKQALAERTGKPSPDADDSAASSEPTKKR